MRTKLVIAAAALAAFMSAPAYAGSHFSVGFYSAPAPVYYAPAQPVYYAPAPVAYYAAPGVVYSQSYYYPTPAPVYYPRAAYARPHYVRPYGYRVAYDDERRRGWR